MAEYVEVMRQARRICASEKECKKCLMWNSQGSYCRTDVLRSSEDDAGTEQIVMDWVEAHPEAVYPTWDEYQDEMFPNHTRGICPMAFGVRCPNGDRADALACADCRSKPMPAEIAEKMGLEPKAWGAATGVLSLSQNLRF